MISLIINIQMLTVIQNLVKQITVSGVIRKTNKNIYLIGDSHANALSVSFLINLYDLGDAYNLVFLLNNLGRCLLSQQSDTTGDVPECSEETFEIFLNKLSKENDIVITIGRYNTWINDKGKERN